MLVKCTFSRYNYQLIVSSFKSDEHTHFFPPQFFSCDCSSLTVTSLTPYRGEREPERSKM